MSLDQIEQYEQALSTLSKEEYDKALKIIMKRHQYNQQYYQKRKQQHQQEQKETKKTGRKPIEDIAQERAIHTLQKYKLKCQRQKKEQQQLRTKSGVLELKDLLSADQTIEEMKATINQLFKKIKEKMP